MNAPTPRCSVVIPLYNHSGSIQQCVDSVLDQSFRDFEIIVVDDGSTDGGGTLVSKMEDSRVRVVTQENGGVSVARNRGIEEARATIVAFLDADDEWYSDYLESIVGLADKHLDCDVYATSYLTIDAEGNEQEPLKRRFASQESEFVFDNYFEAAGVSSPPLWTGTVAASKSALLQIGGFPEGIASGEDLLTWARLFAEFDIAYLPLAKGVYRRDSLSWKHEKRVPEAGDPVGEGLCAILSNPDVPATKKAGLRCYIGLWKKIRASHWIALENRAEALTAVGQSLAYYPWNLKVWLYIPFLLMPSSLRDWSITMVEKNSDQGRGRV